MDNTEENPEVEVLSDSIAEAIAQQVEHASRTATRVTNDKAISAVTNALQDRIDEGSDFTKEIARDIFKAVCEYLGYHADNPFKSKYKVTVKYGYYTTLFSVEVEADSEEEAQEEVEQNLSLKGLTVSGTVEYSGDNDTEEGEFEDYESNDSLIDIDDLDLLFEVEELD